MQENLFGVVDLDSIEKKKRPILNIHLALGKVCVGSKNNFVCRSIPYSPNFLNRKHWAVRAAWKKAWEEEIWARWQDEKKNWKDYKFPLEFRADVTITISCIVPQDQDNAFASMKGVIDGLVKAGILKNDTYNELTSRVVFVKVATRPAEHIDIHIKRYLRK